MSGWVRVKDMEAADLSAAAVELDKWMRFSGCVHLGYISTAVGVDGLIVYWDKTRMSPGDMPETFNGLPVKLKRIGRPMPATP